MSSSATQATAATATTLPATTPATPVHIHKLIDTIARMDEADHEQVFRIIHEHGCRYTHNSNGVFVNMGHVPNDCVQKIAQFAQYWTDQNQHIEQSERVRVELQQVLHENNGSCSGGSVIDHATTQDIPVSHRAARQHRHQPRQHKSHTYVMSRDPSRSFTGSSSAKTSYAPQATSLFGEDHAEEPHHTYEASLNPTEQQLIHPNITHKRRQLNLNKKGKQLLKCGGAVTRVARKCMASEEDRVTENVGNVCERNGVGSVGSGVVMGCHPVGRK